jgi:hypothetical protein
MMDASLLPAFAAVDLALLIAEAVPKVNLTKRRAWQRRG